MTAAAGAEACVLGATGEQADHEEAELGDLDIGRDRLEGVRLADHAVGEPERLSGLGRDRGLLRTDDDDDADPPALGHVQDVVASGVGDVPTAVTVVGDGVRVGVDETVVRVAADLGRHLCRTLRGEVPEAVDVAGVRVVLPLVGAEVGNRAYRAVGEPALEQRDRVLLVAAGEGVGDVVAVRGDAGDLAGLGHEVLGRAVGTDLGEQPGERLAGVDLAVGPDVDLQWAGQTRDDRLGGDGGGPRRGRGGDG